METEQTKTDGAAAVASKGQMTTPETWMDEARQVAAQCWCDDETKDRVMDPVLAESVARRIAVWMDTNAQSERNIEYYRGLLVRCGNAIGKEAFTCDDGCVSEGVLCEKIPELVEAMVKNALRPPSV